MSLLSRLVTPIKEGTTKALIYASILEYASASAFASVSIFSSLHICDKKICCCFLFSYLYEPSGSVGQGHSIVESIKELSPEGERELSIFKPNHEISNLIIVNDYHTISAKKCKNA